MSILVIIIDQDTKECDPNIKNLQTIFNDPFYHVLIVKDYREALIIAHKQYSDLPSLLIRDNSIVLFDIKHLIEKVLTIQADLHFLCSWGDSCHQYTNTDLTGVKWTYDSYASQAVLYMPKCRKEIIKKLKKNCNLEDFS